MSTRDSNQTLSVYFSTDFSASEGVAHGDGLTIADDLVMDDVYQLRDFAERRKLSLHFQTERDLSEVAEGSALGTAGYLVVIDCCVKIMGTSDVTQEVLVLVEVEDDTIAEISLLPLAELKPKSDYRLFGASGSVRIFKYNYIKAGKVSKRLGCIKDEAVDIHYQEDLNKLINRNK